MTFSKNYKPAFVENGFQNLKKAKERFRDHESSSMHAEAVLKLGAQQSSPGVDSLLNKQLDSEQLFHRNAHAVLTKPVLIIHLAYSIQVSRTLIKTKVNN